MTQGYAMTISPIPPSQVTRSFCEDRRSQQSLQARNELETLRSSCRVTCGRLCEDSKPAESPAVDSAKTGRDSACYENDTLLFFLRRAARNKSTLSQQSLRARNELETLRSSHAVTCGILCEDRILDTPLPWFLPVYCQMHGLLPEFSNHLSVLVLKPVILRLPRRQAGFELMRSPNSIGRYTY